MEHRKAQQAAHRAYRLCRGVGHIHDYLPARSRQRTHQRPENTERQVSRQLDDGGRRVYVEGLRRSERRPAHNPQRQRQGSDRPKLQAICGGHRSRTAAKRHNAYKGRQLRERHSVGRLSQRGEDKQEGDALRQIYQPDRHRAVAQVARAE